MFVEDFHGTILRIKVAEPDILVYLAHLFSLRFHASVGKDHPVDTEVPGTGCSFRPKVGSICPETIPLFVMFHQTLVDPVPDESTLQQRISSDDLPIFGKVAQAVPHGMGILAKDKWAV